MPAPARDRAPAKKIAPVNKTPTLIDIVDIPSSYRKVRTTPAKATAQENPIIQSVICVPIDTLGFDHPGKFI